MKKIIIPLIATVSFSFITGFAATYDVTGGISCYAWQGLPQADGPLYCWDMPQTATINDTAPVNSSVNVSITRTAPQFLVNPQPTHFNITCSGSECDYKAVTTTFAPQYTVLVTNGASSGNGSVTMGGTPGTQYVSVQTFTNGIECRDVVGWNCEIEAVYYDLPVTVTSAASVDLNIGMLLDKFLNLFSL